MRNFDDFLKDLRKEELLELVEQAEKKLSAMRTITLRVLVKGAYDYVYATWTDTTGKACQKSLGRWYGEGELKALANTAKPRELDYRIPEKKAKEMQEAGNWEGVSTWLLDDDDFEKVYECKPHEDRLGRPRRLWFNRTKWQADLAQWNEQQKLWTENKWSGSGVGTAKGVAWLTRMEKEGHTIVMAK